MKHYHPEKDENGLPVEILRPNHPTKLTAWGNPLMVATVVPGSAMPSEVGGIPIASWTDAPAESAIWEALTASTNFEEPEFKVKPGKRPASGVVAIEADGRVWLVSPSNQHGGYINTFPKGTIYPGDKVSLRANALKEGFEESGLQVELIGFLTDSDRSLTTTRYYLAKRIGGNPADMGWESQAVHLVPQDQLAKFASHNNDVVVVQALLNRR